MSAEHDKVITAPSSKKRLASREIAIVAGTAIFTATIAHATTSEKEMTQRAIATFPGTPPTELAAAHKVEADHEAAKAQGDTAKIHILFESGILENASATVSRENEIAKQRQSYEKQLGEDPDVLGMNRSTRIQAEKAVGFGAFVLSFLYAALPAFLIPPHPFAVRRREE